MGKVTSWTRDRRRLPLLVIPMAVIGAAAVVGVAAEAAQADPDARTADGDGDVTTLTTIPENLEVRGMVNIAPATGDAILRLTDPSGQVWEVETDLDDFAVQDQTTGRFPFFIEEGAPTNALMVEDDGDVGISTNNPEAKLEVTGASASLLVDQNATNTQQVLLTLENQGAPLMFYRNSSTTNPGWQESLLINDTFAISRLNTGGPELLVHPTGRVQMGPGPNVVFDLFANGNLTISGTLTQNSDAGSKVNVEPADPDAVLEAVTGLELHEWAYRHTPRVRHLGPTAQDFSRVFGLGGSDTGIDAVDADGVALAAIQALAADNEALRRDVAGLEAQVSQLRALIAER